jgi:hypothetical protein
MAVGPHQGVVKLWTKILPSSSCDLVQTWYTAKYDLKVIRQTNFFLPLMGQTALDNSSGRTMKGTLGRKYRNITHKTVLSLM